MLISFFEIPVLQSLLSPNGILGWLVWIILIAGTIWLVRRFPGRQLTWDRTDWIWLLALIVATPISIITVTVRLPADGVVPNPPILGQLLSVFAAIPWVLALIRLGSLPGILLAALSGLLIGFWHTRSPFTLVEFAFMAALLGALLSQSYRTRLFDWLRKPLVAGAVCSLIFPLLFIATGFFWASEDAVASLDFSLSRVAWVFIGFAGPLLLGTLILQVLAWRVPQFVAGSATRQPAPTERSLEARFLFTLGPVVLVAFLGLAALGWWTAGRAADQLYFERISTSVELAADSVPFLLEAGQNLMLQLAGDPELADASPAEALAVLQSHLRAVPYFEQLVLLDTGGNTIVSFPLSEEFGEQSDPQELEAVGLALQGLSLQHFTTPPVREGGQAAQLVFVASVRNSNNQVRRILIGRTNLDTNPFAQPIVQSLQSIDTLGGQGLLVDGDGRIVLAPESAALLLQTYNGRKGDVALHYNDIGPDGARRQIQYQPVTGSNWAVVVQWPVRLTQGLALSIALPMLGILIALAIAAFLVLRFSLRTVTNSLQELVADTQRIAAGDLKAPLATKSVDEVGRLGAAFEKMRQTLQARMEEVQRLLVVSQGISSTLDVRSQIDPILDAALASGATSARLVFRGEGRQKPAIFGRGEEKKLHKDLDAQMLALNEKQNQVLLTNPARARLKIEKGTNLPAALAAFALRHRNEYLGALWLAFEQAQTFGAEQVRYLEILAEQAAKAAVNARLYVDANSARRRFEALLKAGPDLVLLTDEDGQIVYANPAAANLFGSGDGNLIGASLTEMLHQPELFEMVLSGKGDGTTEATIAGRTYIANYSVIEENENILGRALILRDVSDSKRADLARTESLATLSHDLRDPLELTKGYLNMLGMVGDLNEQQARYTEKIERNIDNISRLAGDMLDMERLTNSRGLQIEKISLLPLLADTAQELEPRARQKKIALVLPKAERKAPVIEADATLLQRALYNLLDNAIRVSPRDGEVDIQIDYSEDKAVISITDHGPGIAPVDLPQIFDRSRGSHLPTAGLAIVKSVVDRHGGRAWVESELGTGSTFRLEFPLAQVSKG
ncbi:MAG TPA: ATP-binding protein [Anaerolineales bacterium]|nr:ATP-binding protein [Anaerolineales bacterium]